MTRKIPRRLLQPGSFSRALGVFDMISAKLADAADTPFIYVTGYGISASYLGLPDAGLATYTDMLDRISRIADGVSKPIIADADTGYGGLLNVRHTVRGYEKAGVAAVQLEDQKFPKKCGHTPERRVVTIAEMVGKIRTACDARLSDDTLIIARTDARTAHGLDEALRRGEAYKAAGADIIFIESPESEEEMETIARTIEGPLLINLVHGGLTPILPEARLAELGYTIAIYPTLAFLAASQAIRSAFTSVSDQAKTGPALYPFHDFHQLMGFQDVWEFEKTHAALEA